MILNYEVCTRPDAEYFRFPAKDNDDARRIVEDYLTQTQQYMGTVYAWDPENKEYAHNNGFEVRVTQEPRLQHAEFKAEIRYVKWLKYSAVDVEETFAIKAGVAARRYNTLPEHKDWERHFTCERVLFTDDGQYGAKFIDISPQTDENK